jgi:hypothetical protein
MAASGWVKGREIFPGRLQVPAYGWAQQGVMDDVSMPLVPAEVLRAAVSRHGGLSSRRSVFASVTSVVFVGQF